MYNRKRYLDNKDRRQKKRKQDIAYEYAEKAKVLNWHDAYAKAVFNRKPYYMQEKERTDDRRS